MMTATPFNQAGQNVPTFGSMIVSISPALRSFALRLTKDHSAADDLVQDTLIRAWGAQSRFEPGSNAKAWLFRIARNAFISGLRRARRQVCWDPNRHEIMLVQAAMQDDALYARDLQTALSRLSIEQYDAWLAVGRDGLSIIDAADALGVTAGTVKSRVGRARASIRAYLDRDIGEEKDEPADPAFEGGKVTTRPAREVKAPPTNRIVLSRYDKWKASGATMIG